MSSTTSNGVKSVALVTAGYDLPSAAQYIGCCTRTLHREFERNEEFAERYRKALLMSELDPLNSIRQMSRSNWRTAAWYLERVNPQRYGKRNPTLMKPEEVHEIVDSLVDVIFREVHSPTVRKQIVARLEEMTGELRNVAANHPRSHYGSSVQHRRKSQRAALEEPKK